MSYTIKLRRGTASDWATANPILSEGELGYELDTRYLKIGDGVTPWNDLLYVVDADATGIDLPDPTGLPDGKMVATSAEAWVVVDPPSGEGGGLTYRGSWDAATAYVVNDLVERNGSSYVAIADSTGFDPETSESNPVVGSNTAGTPSFIDQASRVAQDFTVNDTQEVTHVSVRAPSGGIPAGSVIGIATGLVVSTTVASTPYLATGTTTADTAAGDWAEVQLGTPVTLDPGTTYQLVSENIGNSIQSLVSVSFSGVVATSPKYTTSTGVNWGSGYNTSYTMPFRLQTSGQKWGLLAQGGSSNAGGRTYTGFVSGVLSVGIGSTRLYNDSNTTLTVLSVRASVGTAPVGSSVVVDINKNGVSMFGTATKPTIVDGTFTDKRAPDTGMTIADGEYFTVDVDAVGSSVAGSDLTIQIEVAAT